MIGIMVILFLYYMCFAKHDQTFSKDEQKTGTDLLLLYLYYSVIHIVLNTYILFCLLFYHRCLWIVVFLFYDDSISIACDCVQYA